MDEVLSASEEDWLLTLPLYQRNTIAQMLELGTTPEEIIDAWLTVSGPVGTVGFGAGPAVELFRQKIVEQIHGLMCGSDTYAEDRKGLLSTLPSRELFISSVSAWIGEHVGASGVWMAPVVVMLIVTIAKMGLHAWCEAYAATNVNTTST